MEEMNTSRKRVRDDDSDDFGLDFSEVKRVRDDLLGVLEESDAEPALQDLDLFMKSFEEEISASCSSPVPVIDLTSDSGDSLQDLGYLLGASDDDLGLPPPPTDDVTNEVEIVRASSESSEIGSLWGFEDQIPSYDSFEVGFGESFGNEYVALDGLFDHSDLLYPSDYVTYS